MDKIGYKMDTIGYEMDISNRIQHQLDFESVVYQRIMKQIGVIDGFKGNWAIVERQQGKHLQELRKIATIESVGSSTRIEGATLTDEEVEKLLKTVKITRLQSRDEQEVVGYYEALGIILDNYPDIQLEERYIHQLHGILLKYSHKDQSHKGSYKNLTNQVIATYPDGTQRIIFRTTEPHLTPHAIQELLTWTHENLTKQTLHPLLVIATFIYEQPLFMNFYLYILTRMEMDACLGC